MSIQVLFINVCAREESRTLGLCRHFLKHFSTRVACEIQEVNPFLEQLVPLNGTTVQRRIDAYEAGAFDDAIFRYAKAFAAADCIVIGAPYWDLSFPSMLKVYVEHIVANGVTFRYSQEGVPVSLCRAKSLVYLSTSGGYVETHTSGEAYIRDLCKLFHIEDVHFVHAEGLDIWGNDVSAILAAAQREAEAVSSMLSV